MKNPIKGGNLGKNIHARVKNGVLFIRVNLTKNYGQSKSGLSEIVATTRGVVRVPGSTTMKYGVNVFNVLPKATDGGAEADTIKLAA
jgi:hypothetical protein